MDKTTCIIEFMCYLLKQIRPFYEINNVVFHNYTVCMSAVLSNIRRRIISDDKRSISIKTKYNAISSTCSQ